MASHGCGLLECSRDLVMRSYAAWRSSVRNRSVSSSSEEIGNDGDGGDHEEAGRQKDLRNRGNIIHMVA